MQRLVRALAVCCLLLACLPAAAADWENWYGVQDVHPENLGDLPLLAGMNVNLLIATVGLDAASWTAYYEAVLPHASLRIIPILWGGAGGSQTIWEWDVVAGQWMLDSAQYPAAIGAQFITWLKAHPSYLARTAALFSFHEPFNTELPPAAQVDAIRQRLFWSQIHNDIFPGGTMRIYGESITHKNSCASGCVDVAGDASLFAFAQCASPPVPMAYSWLNVSTTPSGLSYFWEDCDDQTAGINGQRAQIDAFYAHIQAQAAAPDGSRTKLYFNIQSYVESYTPTLFSRMPERSEMVLWVGGVAKPKRDKLIGIGWYSWDKIASHYIEWLRNNRYDSIGADRWTAIGEGYMQMQDQMPPGCGIGPELALLLPLLFAAWPRKT